MFLAGEYSPTTPRSSYRTQLNISSYQFDGFHPIVVKIVVSTALHYFCLGVLIYVDGFKLTDIYQFDGFHGIPLATVLN
jgi:hypothetical protein